MLSGLPYQYHLLRPLLEIIKKRPGSTIIDVGGNIGSFALFFAAATGPEGHVYSFEPQNKVFQVCPQLTPCIVQIAR